MGKEVGHDREEEICREGVTRVVEIIFILLQGLPATYSTIYGQFRLAEKGFSLASTCYYCCCVWFVFAASVRDSRHPTYPGGTAGLAKALVKKEGDECSNPAKVYSVLFIATLRAFLSLGTYLARHIPDLPSLQTRTWGSSAWGR